MDVDKKTLELTDEELYEKLADAVDAAKIDIMRQFVWNDIDPLIIKDHNGRYLLLDAYCALVQFRTIIKSKESL